MKKFLFAVSLALLCAAPAMAQEDLVITIKDHKFSPDALTVPAGQKVKIKVVNHDPTPEEFESYDLNREKVVNGNGEITVFIGPLDPGTYAYFGEFNPKTAQGKIIAE